MHYQNESELAEKVMEEVRELRDQLDLHYNVFNVYPARGNAEKTLFAMLKPRLDTFDLKDTDGVKELIQQLIITFRETEYNFEYVNQDVCIKARQAGRSLAIISKKLINAIDAYKQSKLILTQQEESQNATKASKKPSASPTLEMKPTKTEQSKTSRSTSVQSIPAHNSSMMVTSIQNAQEKPPARPTNITTATLTTNSVETMRNTHISQSNTSFELQLINAIAGLGLALFALALLTCPPVSSLLGIAAAFTQIVSTVSAVGTTACFLAAAGLYAYRCNNHHIDNTKTPTLEL